MKKTALFWILWTVLPLSAYELYPRVRPADTEQEIILRAENEEEKTFLARNEIYYLHENGGWSDGENHKGRFLWEKLDSRLEGDTRRVKVMLRGEARHMIRLGTPLKPGEPKPSRRATFRKGEKTFTLYTLRPDLMVLQPWKGAIHQHSKACGHATTPADVIPLYNRAAGFDFMALSEHMLYGPTLEAMEACRKLACGLEAFPAEEFHTRPQVLHSLAIGHRAGVNQWVADHPEEFQKRWQAELKKKEYDGRGLSKWEKEYVAKSRIFYRIAREQGARVLVFCHPTAAGPDGSEDPPERFRQALLDLFEYDALELPFVVTDDRLALMNALAAEQLARGRKTAFVGVSDCHNQDQPGSQLPHVFTVIFAKDCTLAGFADAVLHQRCLGVRKRNTPLKNIAFGPSRLIRYQMFLDREFWPEHDRLCQDQGRLLFRERKGDPNLRPEILRKQEDLVRFRAKFFGTDAK